MYDMHYDLLTILYFRLSAHNRFANKDKLFEDCWKMYGSDNICGGIINLYFMTPEEMKEEIDISVQEMMDLETMFLTSISYFDTCQKLGLIPSHLDVLFGIEGCDYIENEKTLEQLYQYGLRSIIPVWNHKNQYGSGNRTEEGLSDKGERLIQKAIDLGMIIDVSHANEATFNGLMNVIEKNKERNPIVIASHSNVRTLCDRKRNLSDEQLKRLKRVGGYIGLFTNGNFLSFDNETLTYEQRENNFLKHLDYLIDQLQFDIDKICLSTDDMNFHPDSSYHHLEAIPIEIIHKRMFQIISARYGKEVANNIITNNAARMISKVKEKAKRKTW